MTALLQTEDDSPHSYSMPSGPEPSILMPLVNNTDAPSDLTAPCEVSLKVRAGILIVLLST